jgi:DNA polymerase III subunit gamma/tau
MNFEVTATKKRPQSFDDLAGQDFVVSTLKSSVQAERIAHAYLFSGPRGVGKTSAARILAKSLNCQNGPTDTPCNTCSNCVEISRGNSLDVIEIDGASNTSVNDVREIKDEVLFAPNSSRYKVYIIDEVHMLSNSAFNALLKTIEEPPPYIVFIFATTEIHKVPATIRSRCQQFNFRLVNVEVIKERLQMVTNEIGVQADEDALFWIAKEATGSLRDAYTLFDQVVSFSGGHVTLEKIREKLGLVGLDDLNELVEAMAAGNSSRVLEKSDEILMNGVAVEQLIMDLAEYFRNILFIHTGISRETVLGYTADRFSSSVRESFSRSQLEHALKLLLELYRNIRYSLNQRFELELLMSRLSDLKGYLNSREILDQIHTLRSEIVSGSIGSADGSADSGAEAHKTASKSDAFREQVMETMRKKKLTLSAALEKAVSWVLDGDVLRLSFSDSFSANLLRREGADVIQVFNDISGLQARLEIEHVQENNEAESDDTREEDDQVSLVQKVFRGEIVRGESR